MEKPLENNVENYLRIEKEFIGSADYFPSNPASFWDLIDTVSSMTVTGTTTSNKTTTGAY